MRIRRWSRRNQQKKREKTRPLKRRRAPEIKTAPADPRGYVTELLGD
jgi:hypothetical protein